jgi:hypothetical protein
MGLDFGREWYLTYLITVTVPHMSTDSSIMTSM